jgi:hypothetical protein
MLDSVDTCYVVLLLGLELFPCFIRVLYLSHRRWGLVCMANLSIAASGWNVSFLFLLWGIPWSVSILLSTTWVSEYLMIWNDVSYGHINVSCVRVATPVKFGLDLYLHQ